VVSNLDGFVFAGGRDVDPARYGEEAGEHTDTPDLRRDEWEFSLLGAILEQKKPTLFICRGTQVLNVQKGGTLIQHLPDVVGSNKYQLGNAEFTDLELAVETKTNLARIVGKTVMGCAYHHQAIDKVGVGLTVTARSSDGIIEAVEIDDYPFGLAVQWHPEVTSETDGRLFAALIEAAADQEKRK
jgi:putative glutamine amidotransferase